MRTLLWLRLQWHWWTHAFFSNLLPMSVALQGFTLRDCLFYTSLCRGLTGISSTTAIHQTAQALQLWHKTIGLAQSPFVRMSKNECKQNEIITSSLMCSYRCLSGQWETQRTAGEFIVLRRMETIQAQGAHRQTRGRLGGRGWRRGKALSFYVGLCQGVLELGW